MDGCVCQWVRVLKMLDSQWHIDSAPNLAACDSEQGLWAWEARSLARLQWDLEERQWRDSLRQIKTPQNHFFQYTAKLGCHILLSIQGVVPVVTSKHWQRKGLSKDFLTNFGDNFEVANKDGKQSFNLSHRATTLGTQLNFGVNTTIKISTQNNRSSNRFFATLVTHRISRVTCGGQWLGVYSWGQPMGFETKADNFAVEAWQGRIVQIQVLEFNGDTRSAERDLWWKLVSNLALLFVWRARC